MINKLLTQTLKPNHIDEIIGQSHLIGKDGIIRKMIETKQIFSCIFFGFPGIGKTSLANAICQTLKLKYVFYNPTINKKSDLENLLNNHLKEDEKFVLIIDEIHRMNRDKQDILLSYLEKENFIIFGTTTENPYFVLNPAIRSRCQIFELKPISKQETLSFLKSFVKKQKIQVDDEVLELITNNSLGDLRTTINTLDMLHKIYKNNFPSKETIVKILPNSQIVGSSYGKEFYDLQSAFHKSLRGSDVDAAIYYLARLIKIGDLQSISRRMIAMAYEDIGLANPQLISRVILTINSAERLGFPEAHQILATTVIEMCLSPKSNSAYLAIKNALQDVETLSGAFDIPNHLKDTHYKSSSKLGYNGYKYPHDYPNHWIEQDYLPREIKGRKYYFEQNNEIELKMNNNLKTRIKHDKSK